MALPESAGYQARIDAILAGISNLSSIFNPRRQRTAAEASAQLDESGYTWGSSLTPTTDAGNTVYGINTGKDGRVYKDSARSINDSLNARGAYYSSYNVRAQQDQRRQLDAARNAILRQAASGQQSLTDQQADADRGYRADLGTTRGEYADWQAQQAAQAAAAAKAAEPAPAPAPTPAPIAPGTLATPNSAAGSYPTWTGSAPPNLKNLAKAWGVPASAIRVTPLAGGKFRAWAQAAPNTGPRF